MHRKRAPSHAMTTRRSACVFFLALVALGACASLDARSLTLSQAELQALLERQFPRQQRVFELLDMSLSRPSLRLVPERNRLFTALELAATERLSGRQLRGSLGVEHGLRFEPVDATLRLAQVRVEAFQLALAGTPLSGQAARLGALLAERSLEDFVVYRLSDEKRQLMARAGVNNAELAVTARGVEMRFVPAR
jgi:hypothetical protein